jgi:hypothetical protein
MAQNFTAPNPPDRIDRAYVDRLLESIRRAFSFTVSTQSATNEILLLSPGGKVYSVTVSDVGTVTATYVSG